MCKLPFKLSATKCAITVNDSSLSPPSQNIMLKNYHLNFVCHNLLYEESTATPM